MQVVQYIWKRRSSTASGPGSAPFFNPPLQVDTYNCDGKLGSYCAGNTAAQHIQTIFSSYDQYGNVTAEYQSGDINDSTDTSARTVTRNFLSNATAWIINLPANETIYNGATGTKVASTSYFYDGTTTCTTASASQPPTKGNPTCIARWVDGVNDPSVGMTYDAYGNLASTRDPKGYTSTIGYDGTFTFPTVATNALGQKTTTQYYTGTPADAGLYGQAQSVTDPNGVVTTVMYDTFGRKTRATAPDGTWMSWTYVVGAVGVQNVEIDTSAGISTWNYFDGLGRTTAEKKTGINGKVVTTTSYNTTGTVAQTSLPYFENTQQPSLITYTYDSMGRPTGVNNPDGTSVSSCYANGVTVVIDANTHYKRATKNVHGKLVKVEEYQGTLTSCPADPTSIGITPYATTTYAYDVLGNLLTVTDNKVNITQMRYDSLGRKKYMSDPDMGVWQYGYDLNGNLLSQTDAKGQIITFTYDPLNRVTLKHYQTGTDVSYTYDVNPDGSATSYPVGRRSTMTDASGSTKYFYDIMGRSSTVTKIVDGTPYTTVATYDNGGRLASLQYPDSDVVNYGYDAGGNLLTVSGALGSGATSYGSWNSVFCGDLDNCWDTSYDSCNNDSTNAYTCQPGFVGTCNDTANYYYSDDDSGAYWDYRTVTCGQAMPSVSISYSNYNALGQPGNIAYGNGVNTTYTYNASNNRLTSLVTNGPNSTALLNLSYGYDYVGNITGITDGLNAARSQSFGYDELNRLRNAQSGNYASNNYGAWQAGYCDDYSGDCSTSYDTCDGNAQTAYVCTTGVACNDVANLWMDSSDGSDPMYWNYRTVSCGAPLSYVYDEIGNILSKEGINYDQYGLNAGPHAVTHTSDGKAYTYDANGNMLTDGTRVITYNYDNMPQSITASGVTTTFVYDGSGMRVKKIRPSATTVYIGKLYECVAGACSKYIFAGDTRIAHKASDTVYFSQDHLGSTRVVTDANGNKSEDIYYYPFGGAQSDSGAVSMTYKYTSQEFDAETGLYNYNARLYNPSLGRFISPDAIVPDPSNPQAFNRYSYVINNPIMYTDPSGHDFWKHLMHEASRPQNAFIIQNLNLLTGSYFLTQSMAGRNILAGEIVVGTAAATFYCGGCGAVNGALTGEVAGGISAERSGGDVLNGVVVGGAVGAATGYMGSQVAHSLISYPAYAAGFEGAVDGFGIGVATGYAGGKGDWNAMVRSGLNGAASGYITGGLTFIGGLYANALGLKGGNQGLTDVLFSVGSGLYAGLKSQPVKSGNNEGNKYSSTSLNMNNFKMSYSGVESRESDSDSTLLSFPVNSRTSLFKALNVNGF